MQNLAFQFLFLFGRTRGFDKLQRDYMAKARGTLWGSLKTHPQVAQSFPTRRGAGRWVKKGKSRNPVITTMPATLGCARARSVCTSEGACSRGDPHNSTLRQQAHAHVHTTAEPMRTDLAAADSLQSNTLLWWGTASKVHRSSSTNRDAHPYLGHKCGRRKADKLLSP